ncbi:hypothetical protein [Streptomyces violascens]|uniref:hypothetical protein n=1 Tax=Streptomyces violascens TaxID=67381 RepID=UPI0036C79B41
MNHKTTKPEGGSAQIALADMASCLRTRRLARQQREFGRLNEEQHKLLAAGVQPALQALTLW